MEQYFTDFFLAISPALNVLLQSVFVAIGGLLAAYVKKQIDLARASLTANEQYALDLFITMGVRAAQQIYAEKDGAGKKAYVMELAENYVAQVGLLIDFEALDAKVEAAVFNIKAAPIVTLSSE